MDGGSNMNCQKSLYEIEIQSLQMHFWRYFFKKVGIKQMFGTTFQSKLAEQTERVNGISNQYLKNLVRANQQYWVDNVDRAECNINAAMYLVIKMLPFVVAYEVDLLQPGNPTLNAVYSTQEFNHHGEDLAKKHEQVLVKTKLLLEKTQNAIKNMSMSEDTKWRMRWAKRCCCMWRISPCPKASLQSSCPNL
jgi:hypothetical protein